MQFAPEGPRSKLDGFIRRHTSDVWHYLRVCGCDPETADDLTQEAFMVAFKKGFDPEPEHSARRYMRRTARFVFLQHRRRRARDRWERGSDAWLELTERDWEERRRSDHLDVWLNALRKCRDTLRGKRGQAVTLFYGEGRSRAEVAEALSMSENGVKTLLQRVRADLRGCVERAMS